MIDLSCSQSVCPSAKVGWRPHTRHTSGVNVSSSVFRNDYDDYDDQDDHDDMMMLMTMMMMKQILGL